MTLGVVFFGILLCLGYLYVVDPWNLKPLFFSKSNTVAEKPDMNDIEVDDSVNNTTETAAGSMTESEVETDKSPALTPGQEDALMLIGIDPEVLPDSLTPEQEACFIAKLGETRVLEIKAGATPSVTEIFSAKGCI
jgi:hypothetical protein